VLLGGGNEGSRVMLLRDGRLQIHRRGVVDDILDVLALGKHGAIVAVHREVPDLPRCEAPDVKSGLEVLAGAVGSLAVVLRPGQALLSPPEQFRASFGFGPLQEGLLETQSAPRAVRAALDFEVRVGVRVDVVSASAGERPTLDTEAVRASSSGEPCESDAGTSVERLKTSAVAALRADFGRQIVADGPTHTTL